MKLLVMLKTLPCQMIMPFWVVKNNIRPKIKGYNFKISMVKVMYIFGKITIHVKIFCCPLFILLYLNKQFSRAYGIKRFNLYQNTSWILHNFFHPILCHRRSWGIILEKIEFLSLEFVQPCLSGTFNSPYSQSQK